MTPDDIIRRYYGLAGLYTLAASLIWGVNTLFLLDAGLSIQSVFVVNAVFSGGMVLFEIPTGVVADTLGRRVSYLLAIAVLAVTTLLYLICAETESGPWVFGLVSVFMGLGFTFYSGALEAWLVDALRSVGEEGDLDRVFARSAQVTGLAMLFGTTAGGFLGQLDLAVPFIVRAVLLVALFGVAFRSMFDLGFEPRPLALDHIGEELREQTRVGVTFGWRHPGMRLLMLSGMVRGAFLSYAFYAMQPYMLELLESDAVWVVGVITAAMSLSTILGNQFVEILTRRCGRRSTIIFGGSLMTSIGLLGMGLTDTFGIAVAFFLLVTTSIGVMTPVRQAYVHHVAPTEHRATVISFDAMVGSIGGTGGQLALGRLADARGFAAGYVTGGVLTALALPLIAGVRCIGGEPDQIVGSSARKGTCPQGLPRDSHVESHPAEVLASER
ncbi:MAG: MFS transporter [Actinomycetota bacterium]